MPPIPDIAPPAGVHSNPPLIMAKVDFDTALAPLLARDTRYARGAYHFVREALDHTQATLLKQGEAAPRHVTGRELLEGIRSYALDQFGPMACTVFEEWGVRRCDDFGEIVFNMIEFQILSKTDTDRPEDFKGGYDFEAAFRRPFEPAQGPPASASA